MLARVQLTRIFPKSALKPDSVIQLYIIGNWQCSTRKGRKDEERRESYSEVNIKVLLEQQPQMLTHQPLRHLPPHSTADYFVNTVEQSPCLYVVERLHNNNVTLLCTRINHPPSPGVRKPMKTLQIYDTATNRSLLIDLK